MWRVKTTGTTASACSSCYCTPESTVSKLVGSSMYTTIPESTGETDDNA